MNYGLIEINSCPVCNCNEYTTVFTKNEFKGEECKQCGLIYLNPRINNLEAVYVDDKTSSTSRYYKFAIEADRKIFKKRLKLIEEFAEKGSFLDVGCSIGTFLEIAIENGWNHVLGVEPNPKSANACKENELPVINDFFKKDLFRDGQKFDAVYIGDVIEHVPNPKEILEDIYNILNENGIVMVVTPNFSSIVARLLQIKPFEHILYFTKKSISYLFSKTNFKIEKNITTTRDRSVKAMLYSTTFKTNSGRRLVKIIVFLHLEKLINALLRIFVRDEVLVIARKQYRI